MRPSAGFTKTYDKLPLHLQKRVVRTIDKLRSAPALRGLHVEPVKAASPYIRSCRVDAGVRLIFQLIPPDGIELLYVGSHQDAYRFAEHRLATWTSGVLPSSPQDTTSPVEFIMWTERCESRIHEALQGLDGEGLPSFVEFQEPLTDIIMNGVEFGTEGTAPQFIPDAYTGADIANVIPSTGSGECRPILLVFCFDDDSFDDRLREAAYHASIFCPETRLVILITSHWDAKTWKTKHQAAFEKMNAQSAMLFVGFDEMVPIDAW
jgi:hypothetical protein